MIFLDRWSLAHPKTLLLFAAMLPLLAFMYFFYDRDPPTIITGVPAIPRARVGEEVTINVPMDRDLGRNCSVSITRSIVDSSLQNTILVPHQEIGPQGLRLRDEMDEHYFHVKFTIPVGLPSGRAHLLTDASWMCGKNPTTWVMPIRRTWDWPFDILPPDPTKQIIIIAPTGS